MSAPTQAPAGTPGWDSMPAPQAPPAPGETCPLCGAPLHPDQEWCLNCGAAARTRIAASPNWKAPLVIALVVAVLSLGVLAAALVKLAGSSGSSSPATTRTITTAASSPTPTSTTATAPATTAATSTTTTTTSSTPGTGGIGTTGATGTATATTTTPAGAVSTLPASVRAKLLKRLRGTGVSVEHLRKLGLLPAK